MKEYEYMRVYKELRANIIGKTYPYGAKLPSKRVLADQMGVGLITVERAYSILKDEGYIDSREKSGYFVIYNEQDRYLSSASPGEPHPVVSQPAFPGEPHPVVSQPAFPGEPHPVASQPVLSGEPHPVLPRPEEAPLLREYFPFSNYARAVRRVLSEQEDLLYHRSESAGIAFLREAICSYSIRTRQLEIRPEQIIVGSGAEYLYGIIILLLGRERLYALEDPSYSAIRTVYEAYGAPFEALRLGRSGILSEELQRSAADVLHVTPYNSYPSGITASASKRHEYLAWAQETPHPGLRRYIIEDDYSSEFSLARKSGDTLFSLSAEENVIYMNSFSRTVAPSIRIGYMVLPEDLLEPYQDRFGSFSCTVPMLDQLVLAEIINSGEFERHINRMRRKMRRS